MHDESGNDPTYGDANHMFLVESNTDPEEDNPCTKKNRISRTKAIPKTEKDLEAFAKMLGWIVDYDTNGQILLCTGVNAE